MKNLKNNGFTFVEMLVGIALSVIIMVGVGVFVTSGMKNITLQKQVLDNTLVIGDLYDELGNIFNNDFSYVGEYSSGLLFKTKSVLGKGDYTYFGTLIKTGECVDDPMTQTKYLVLNDFSPFEGDNGSLFSKSYSSGGISVDFFDNKIYNLGTAFTGEFLNISGIAQNGNDIYVADSLKSGVYKLDKTNLTKKPELLVGKEVFGDYFLSGSLGTGIYLNNPTGLAYGNSKLFISDTSNNRVLYLSGNLIYPLLDINDGIYQPKGLYFDNLLNRLYIVNSGKSEILTYDFSSKNNGTLDLKFDLGNIITFDSVDIIPSSGSFTGNYSKANFGFDANFNTNPTDTGTGNSSNLSYKFKFSQSLSSGKISLLSFSGTFAGSNYSTINFYNSGVLQKSYISPFLTIGDGNIATKSDNLLSIFATGITSPTGIYPDVNSIYVNDFDSRKFYKYSTGGIFQGISALQSIDFDGKNLKTLSFKIKDFSYSVNSGFLNLKITYYKNFSCFDETQNILKTIIYKKKL